MAARAGSGHSCVALQLPAWPTLAMGYNQEQSRNRDKAVFLMLLASSWAPIYSLYIRLPSQNRKKWVHQKRVVLSDHLGARNVPKRYTESFHLWYLISARIPDRLAHAQSCTIQMQTYWWNKHTRWYPLVCELFVTWVHGHISTKVNWAIGEKSCAWETRSDALVIYQNIPIAQHTQWEPNKHPDKLQMVAKSYAEK